METDKLTARLKRGLEELGCETFDRICSIPHMRIRAIRGLGRKSMLELEDFLKENNRELEDNKPLRMIPINHTIKQIVSDNNHT